MKQFTITIQDKEGLHARPAGLLSKAAKGFQCAVTLTKGEKTADLKKIFAVMGLAVKGGDSFTVACDGGLPPNGGRPFLILPAYLPVFSHSFCMITATCARVAVPCGSKRLPDLPLSRPAFCILVTASFA